MGNKGYLTRRANDELLEACCAAASGSGKHAAAQRLNAAAWDTGVGKHYGKVSRRAAKRRRNKGLRIARSLVREAGLGGFGAKAPFKVRSAMMAVQQ